MKRQGETFALLVSVGLYAGRGKNLSDLSFFGEDLRQIKEGLTAGLGISPDRIRIPGEQGYVTMAEFARAMADFSGGLQENDRFIFYFSGHGNAGSLCFSDGDISLQSIEAFMEKMPAREKILILDCCGPEEITFSTLPSVFSGAGMTVLAGAGPSEKTWTGEKCSSVFTTALSYVMQLPHLVRRGRISLADISDCVENLVALWNRSHPGKMQIPVYRKNAPGTVYFYPVEKSWVTPGKPEEEPCVTPGKPEGECCVTPGKPEEICGCRVISRKNLSTARLKRTAFFLMTGSSETDDADLSAVTDEGVKKILKEQPCDVVLFYFGKDTQDMAGRNYFARGEWTGQIRGKRGKGRIRIYRNPSYSLIRRMQTPSAGAAEDYRRLFEPLVSAGESVLQEIHEKQSATPKKPEDRTGKAEEVLSLYRRLSDLDMPSAADLDLTNRILETAGYLADIAMLLQKPDPAPGDWWLIHITERHYQSALENLRNLCRNN